MRVSEGEDIEFERKEEGNECSMRVREVDEKLVVG